MKETVKRITESDIRRMVAKCLREIIHENKKKDRERKYGINGYYIEKDGVTLLYKGEKMKSIISVIHRSGEQAYHICIDDHCYVFYVSTNGEKEVRKYEFPYIFDELLEAIKMLPIPS